MKPISLALGLALAIAFGPGVVQAQYGGWGGWGGGSTVAGSNARGLGVFSAGRGIYNLDTAQARSINTNTAMQWNEYVFQSTMAARKRYWERVRAQSAATNKAYGEIQDRLRNHPETRDITNGDALNVLLDTLLNPAIASRSVQYIKTPLRHDIIPDIPFEVASEGLTVCLDSMTSETDWPVALRAEAFKPERTALKTAIQKALGEDEKGNLEPETIQAVQKAINQLKAKFEQQIPQNDPSYIPVRDTIKGIAGIVKMLDSSKIEKVLAELEDYQGTTLGDLLGFMQAFNLRFGPANSYRQRQIYLKLYPMLAEQAGGSAASSVTSTVNQAAGAAENVGAEAINGMKSTATNMFKDMGWEHLGSGSTTPPPPPPVSRP